MLSPLEKSLPLISCLMVTANGRFEYLKKSVSCYIDQTYPNKELVIINEGPLEYQMEIRKFLEELDRPDIRTEFLYGKYTLGGLRNISLGLAHGSVFCQWDDDDFNYPTRLAVQYAFLQRNSRIKVCYLSDQLHYYFQSQELYWEDWKLYLSSGNIKYMLIPGTIMGYLKDLPARYPSGGKKCKSGEDTVFSNQLLRLGVPIDVLSGYGNLQIYTYHGKNVFDMEHHKVLSRIRSYYRTDILEKRHLISETLDYLNVTKNIRVMGRDGLAFIYEVNHVDD